ncbi:MAG: O-antigen ligase family protein [Desulfovibrionaceae bacterium]|nr:O-antigen ligase family protein [Desulfovibrionaceae bacterium]
MFLDFLRLKLASPDFCFQAMFVTFCAYLVGFASGYGFREVLPPISFLFLLAYYRLDYVNSNLQAFQGKGYLLLFGLFLIFSILTSNQPLDSFLHVGRGLNKQFMVFFLALECAKNRQKVRLLAWMLLLGCYLEGLACVHQALTGYDLIHGDPLLSGRLTGTMAWYWVGSYLVLAGIPCLALACELWQSFGRGIGSFLVCALLLPPLFGIVFGGSRASYLAALATAAFSLLIHQTKLSRKQLALYLGLPTLAIIALLFFFGEGRFSLSGLVHDSRLTLWGYALKVFAQDPLTGVGAWQYRPTVQSLPLAATSPAELVNLSHPHNVYLQVLCETGLIGSLFCFLPIFALFLHGGRLVCQILRRPQIARQKRELAHLAFFFWLGCFAYFVHGLVGHDFFRPWYQALFFVHLGILQGAATALQINLKT